MRIETCIGPAAVALSVLCVNGVVGQELSIKRDLPALPSNACEARGFAFELDPYPSEEAEAEAEGLASDANLAAILGEYDRARSLLSEASALHPRSTSISYRFGRLLEDGGEREAALSEFCRFIVIDAQAVEVAEVEVRIERIGLEVGAVGAGSARVAFEDGVSSFDLGDYEEAVLDFSRALVELPDWDQAHFNRAVAYLQSGRDASGAADLEWYLELVPDASDRVEVEVVLDALGPVTEVQYGRSELTP